MHETIQKDVDVLVDAWNNGTDRSSKRLCKRASAGALANGFGIYRLSHRSIGKTPIRPLPICSINWIITKVTAMVASRPGAFWSVTRLAVILFGGRQKRWQTNMMWV